MSWWFGMLLFAAAWALAAGMYGVILLIMVPGAREDRLGRRRAIPEHLLEWTAGPESAAAAGGLIREERIVVQRRGLLGSRLVRQVRYRDSATGEIERVERERRVRRSELNLDEPRRPS